MAYSQGRNIEAGTAARWLSAGEAMLVDVREPDEFRAEHIAFAASVPMASVLKVAAELPNGQKIVFQCLSGGRAGQACSAVAAAFPGLEVYNLDGGIGAWKAAGLPVIGVASKSAAFPSLFRQVQIAVGLLLLITLTIGWLVNPAVYAVAGAISAMLVFAGVTGWCGMAMFLSRLPWNRGL